LQSPSEDSKFIQQHLANERTYLAWVRTSIAIIGLGFLAAGLVFHSNSLNRAGEIIATIGGIGTVLMGGSVLAFATRDFFLKREGINENRFRSPTLLIWFVFSSLGIICSLLVLLVIMMLL
jgi:putative membrane protein